MFQSLNLNLIYNFKKVLFRLFKINKLNKKFFLTFIFITKSKSVTDLIQHPLVWIVIRTAYVFELSYIWKQFQFQSKNPPHSDGVKMLQVIQATEHQSFHGEYPAQSGEYILRFQRAPLSKVPDCAR